MEKLMIEHAVDQAVVLFALNANVILLSEFISRNIDLDVTSIWPWCDLLTLNFRAKREYNGYMLKDKKLELRIPSRSQSRDRSRGRSRSRGRDRSRSRSRSRSRRRSRSRSKSRSRSRSRRRSRSDSRDRSRSRRRSRRRSRSWFFYYRRANFCFLNQFSIQSCWYIQLFFLKTMFYFRFTSGLYISVLFYVPWDSAYGNFSR